MSDYTLYYHCINVIDLYVHVFIFVLFFFLYLVLSSDADTKVGMWMLFFFPGFWHNSMKQCCWFRVKLGFILGFYRNLTVGTQVIYGKGGFLGSYVFCLFGFLGFFGLHVLIFELLVLYIFFLHVLQSFTFINFLRISYAVS